MSSRMPQLWWWISSTAARTLGLVRAGELNAKGPSNEIHEAIQHPLPPRMLEVDLELIAFDLRHNSVAELGVEDALAHCHVASPRIAQAHRGGSRFHHPRGGAFEAAGHCPSPAGAPGLAAGDVGEGVGAFGPVGPPQGLATRHRLLLRDMGFGEPGHE